MKKYIVWFKKLEIKNKIAIIGIIITMIIGIIPIIIELNKDSLDESVSKNNSKNIVVILKEKLNHENKNISTKVKNNNDITDQPSNINLFKNDILKPTIENLAIQFPWIKKDLIKIFEEYKNEFHNTLDFIEIFGDLNHDGIPELINTHEYSCGASNCNYPIYTIDIQKKTIREIANVFSDDINDVTLNKIINGWSPIVDIHCMSAVDCQITLYVYENNEYKFQGVVEETVKGIEVLKKTNNFEKLWNR